MAHQAPCRSLPWPYCGLPLGRVAAHTDCVTSHVTRRVAGRPRALLCIVSQPPRLCCGTYPTVSQHCITTHPVAKPSSYHDTSDCIVTRLNVQATLLSRYRTLYRDTHSQRPGPCARTAGLARRLTVSWGLSAVSWPSCGPSRGALLAVSLPLLCAPCACVTIQCTVS